MLCDSCHQRESTIHVTQVVDGNARELHLCPECAEESGLNVKNVMSIPEMLFGMAAGEDSAEMLKKTCPYCHLRGSDFRKGGRLGCPGCYEAFREELQPMLAAMHKGMEHKGKVPQVEREARQVASRAEELRKALETAIRREDYEEAARLRDRLRGESHEAG